MKLKAILIICLVIAILSNVGIYYLYHKSQIEGSRLKTNQTALAMRLQANEKLYTVKEFQQYKHSADSLAKLHGIVKTKQIGGYIQLHDSIFRTDTIILDPEIESNVRAFDVITPCYKISVLSLLDTNIVTLDYKTDLSLFLYWEWQTKPFIKRLFKWNFDKTYTAKAVKECDNSEINIKENIQVMQK